MSTGLGDRGVNNDDADGDNYPEVVHPLLSPLAPGHAVVR